MDESQGRSRGFVLGKDSWLSSLPGVFAQSVKPEVPIIVDPVFGEIFFYLENVILI